MTKALLLFSEGLDSILAGKILKDQGIHVTAVKYITPFFGWELKKNPEKYYKNIEQLGFDEGEIIDISTEYLELLKKPRYGYGSHANPCIDCKILMINKTFQLLKEGRADFIATGEVLGQRPMSQNRNALVLIKKNAEFEDLLLRPLSAKLLFPTKPEREGLVNREKLLSISGRSRHEQLSLAERFGIKDIPSPASGCLLTDPVIGDRVLAILKNNLPLNTITAELLTIGRHYIADGTWIMLGRNYEENKKLFEIASSQYKIYCLSEPSPLGIVLAGDNNIDKLFELLVKYSKKARLAIENGKEISLQIVKNADDI
ncbi:MAG: tRNA-uridine 2-sulfurtransferase [Rikenellaceae bacterium]|nr:tRNA-uridine 2-sulfurtransferase [Rikenellaceae bacterium]MDN5355513.1 tRNA-uridine 2-sulfurtransferase [Rikenellaceae bacterium]